MQCYMPTTGIVIITDTFEYFPKEFYFPKTTTKIIYSRPLETQLQLRKTPPKKITLLSYGYATKNAINQIFHILHRNTYQPHLQILPLPPMLPQTQSENLQLQNIPSIPVPALMVELVSQPPIVQTHQSLPTSPTRLHRFT